MARGKRPNGYEPQHCHDCGAPVVEFSRVTGKFDRDDGTPRIEVWLACPDWAVQNCRRWHVGFFSHERYHMRLEEKESKAKRVGRIGFDPERLQ